jgi:hypothetical protein
MDFGITDLTLIAAIFFLAAFLHGSIGFGFPLVSTPLLALITDLQTAILLTLLPTILVNLVSIYSEGHFFVALKRFYAIALLSILGTVVGTHFLLAFDPEFFKVLLAATILAYLIADRIKIRFNWIRHHPFFSKVLFGLSAGLLGGMTNVMAPALIIYSLESGHSKSDLIRVSNICFLTGKITQLLVFSLAGEFTLNELSQSPLMFLVVGLALYTGLHIRKRMRGDLYIHVLKGFLLLLSVMLFVQAASNSLS